MKKNIIKFFEINLGGNGGSFGSGTRNIRMLGDSFTESE